MSGGVKPGDVWSTASGASTLEVWTHGRHATVRVFDDRRQAHAAIVLDVDSLGLVANKLAQVHAGLAARLGGRKP